MANAKLRRKACEGLRELNAQELGLVSGAWGFFGSGADSRSLTIPKVPQRIFPRRIVPVVIPRYI